jgi:RNA polymerase sigma-70 factor (ECF subfamily)
MRPRTIDPIPAPSSQAASDAELVMQLAAEGGRMSSGAMAPEASSCEAELYRRYHRRCYLYGLKHLSDADAAWDLAQEALTSTLVKLRAGELREPERLGSFLLGTCRFLAAGAKRTHARRGRLLAQYADPSAAAGLAEHVGDRERLLGCLGRLRDREQTVLVLSYYVELDAAAIAAELGTSPSHVRVLRHRAFEQLQACVRGAEAA